MSRLSRHAPKSLFAVCCGTCGVFVAAEPFSSQALLHRPTNCPPAHSEINTIITGPYEFAEPVKRKARRS